MYVSALDHASTIELEDAAHRLEDERVGLSAERVGHNDGGALIYRRYRHLFPTEVREAVSMLDRMVAGSSGNAETGGSTGGQ